MNTDYQFFKNSPSICYIFFATDDLIVTSVNAHTNSYYLCPYVSNVNDGN